MEQKLEDCALIRIRNINKMMLVGERKFSLFVCLLEGMMMTKFGLALSVYFDLWSDYRGVLIPCVSLRNQDLFHRKIAEYGFFCLFSSTF